MFGCVFIRTMGDDDDADDDGEDGVGRRRNKKYNENNKTEYMLWNIYTFHGGDLVGQNK